MQNVWSGRRLRTGVLWQERPPEFYCLLQTLSHIVLSHMIWTQLLVPTVTDGETSPTNRGSVEEALPWENHTLRDLWTPDHSAPIWMPRDSQLCIFLGHWQQQLAAHSQNSARPFVPLTLVMDWMCRGWPSRRMRFKCGKNLPHCWYFYLLCYLWLCTLLNGPNPLNNVTHFHWYFVNKCQPNQP